MRYGACVEGKFTNLLRNPVALRSGSVRSRADTATLASEISLATPASPISGLRCSPHRATIALQAGMRPGLELAAVRVMPNNYAAFARGCSTCLVAAEVTTCATAAVSFFP